MRRRRRTGCRSSRFNSSVQPSSSLRPRATSSGVSTCAHPGHQDVRSTHQGKRPRVATYRFPSRRVRCPQDVQMGHDSSQCMQMGPAAPALCQVLPQLHYTRLDLRVASYESVVESTWAYRNVVDACC